MHENERPEEELRDELTALRQRVAQLEQADAERQRLTASLRESEEKWRTVVQNVPDFITTLDEQGTILFINRVLPGYDHDKVVGSSTFDYLPRESHPPIRAAIHRLFATGEPYEVEVAGAGSPGEVRYYVSRGSPSYRDGRVVAVLQISSDVTKHKQAEEQLRTSLKEKEMLPREIHHRVKNNLQVVNSLLSLQAAQVKDPAALNAFRESQDRVRSMALIHEGLYRSRDMARIDLAAHVDSLCANLFRSYGVDPGRIELRTRIADLALDLDRAIPCGLLLNELVSNALKHAFPEGRRGWVAVDLRAGPDGTYTLSVADNGVGLPPGLDFRRTESLGLQLVCTLVTQLGGTITVNGGPGTTFTVTFHAQAPARPGFGGP